MYRKKTIGEDTINTHIKNTDCILTNNNTMPAFLDLIMQRVTLVNQEITSLLK
jgi:hypothetical protein